jgi:hypothetical protein
LKRKLRGSCPPQAFLLLLALVDALPLVEALRLSFAGPLAFVDAFAFGFDAALGFEIVVVAALAAAFTARPTDLTASSPALAARLAAAFASFPALLATRLCRVAAAFFADAER